MHKFDIEERLKRILSKLSKKDKHQHEIIIRKIDEVVSSYNIEHYKNLKKPLQHLKRVHIDKHFVLVFRYVKNKDLVIFYDLDHHDNIYRKVS